MAFHASSLAFALLLPVFLILGALYLAFPRRPRSRARVIADLAVLAAAAIVSIAAMRWGFRTGSEAAGAIWKQVLATLLAYGAFLAVLVIALPLRARWLRQH